ncbi:MAG TPA: septum formation protein Maf [Gammaproteobacteria bacterium]|nr:septum formation protein Maf [Gammaproteobacteria bacterium]
MSKFKPDPPLILASTSPFRRELLARLGLEFEVIPPGVDETALSGEDARELALRLSKDKADSVAATIKKGLVIGSDQVALVGTEILGKPVDREDAIRQLTKSSGKEMHLYTGLTLVNAASGRTQQDVISYSVKYRDLTRDQVEQYLELDAPFGCCGSLRAESLGIALLRELSGPDPSALIGLPLISLVEMLNREGLDVLARS